MLNYNLFSDSGSKLSYTAASNDSMTLNYELDVLWKEAVMTVFRVIFRHLPEGTKENNENFCNDRWVSWPRFQLGTSRIPVRRLPFEPPCFWENTVKMVLGRNRLSGCGLAKNFVQLRIWVIINKGKVTPVHNK
jgi:hypothetical protein